MKDPILITGCARSGTSMTAGIFSICGAFGGKTYGPNKWNRSGMYENCRVRDGIIKPYFRSLGVDPLGQFPLPDVTRLAAFPALGDMIRATMLAEGYDGTSVWFYKCAKATLVWPVFEAAFPAARWIIVRRDDSAIVLSCLNTAFMRAYDEARGWQGWVNHHKAQFAMMIAAMPDRVREVWPSRWVEAGDFSEIREAVEWSGLTWRDEEVRRFCRPELWNSNREVKHGTR